MRCWVLFKSYEECWYMFSRQLTWLGSDYKCQPTVCGLWFQHPLSVSLWCYSGPSCAQSKAWVVVCLLIHSSESLIVGQEQIHNAEPRNGWALMFMNSFIVLNESLSQALSGCLRLPFCVFWPKLELPVTPFCHTLSWLPASWASWQDNAKRSRDSLCLLRTRAPLFWKEGPSLNFGSCQLPLQPGPPQLRDCLRAETRDNGSWEFPFHSLSLF